MKSLIIAILFCISFSVAGQPARRLDKLGSSDTIPVGQAAFYGDFVQRLKFKSGGVSTRYPVDKHRNKRSFCLQGKIYI